MRIIVAFACVPVSERNKIGAHGGWKSQLASASVSPRRAANIPGFSLESGVVRLPPCTRSRVPQGTRTSHCCPQPRAAHTFSSSVSRRLSRPCPVLPGGNVVTRQDAPSSRQPTSPVRCSLTDGAYLPLVCLPATLCPVCRRE